MRRLALAILLSRVILPAQVVPLTEAIKNQDVQNFLKLPAKERTSAIKDLLGSDPIVFNDRVKESALGIVVGTESYYKLVRNIEAKRLDKQVGSSSSSSGSTGLVSSGTIPKVLGFAVENGALAQTTNGTVATFRGNLLGISRLLLGIQNYPYCAPTSTDCAVKADALRGLSFGASFDASRGTTGATATTTTAATGAPASAVLTGTGRQLESWSVRWDLFNRRDVRDSVFLEAWHAKMNDPDLAKNREAFAAAQEQLVQYVLLPNYQKLVKDLSGKLETVTEAGFQSLIDTYVDQAVELAKKELPDFSKTVATALETQADYIAIRDTLTSETLARMSFSAEYVNSRPLNQPTQSTVRFIVAGSPMKNEKVMLTANTAFNWYNTVPADAKVKQFRDFQAALQLDRKLGSISTSVDVAMSLAGYYQYMADKALITIGAGNIAPGSGIVLPGTAATLLAPAGHIGIVQGKLTVSIKNSPVKIPISVTWANRTELIKESDVRGQVGITLDMDSLFMNAKKN